MEHEKSDPAIALPTSELPDETAEIYDHLMNESLSKRSPMSTTMSNPPGLPSSSGSELLPTAPPPKPPPKKRDWRRVSLAFLAFVGFETLIVWLARR